MQATATIYQFPEVIADPIGSRQMRASEVIARLQELVAKHGDLKIDGVERLEHYGYSRMEKKEGMRDYFLIC